MVTTTMDLQEAQIRFSDLVKLVASGTEVILTQNKTPFIRLLPISKPLIPIALNTNAVTDTTEAEEREMWSLAALANLNDAYADDEPEYTLSMIKEPNPTYEGR